MLRNVRDHPDRKKRRSQLNLFGYKLSKRIKKADIRKIIARELKRWEEKKSHD